MDFIARNQYIFQSGVPKMDLCFYSKVTTYASINSFYEPNDLVETGYAYEYVSPDDFSLPEAYVANGVFAPERQAFKAMMLRANDSLTVQGVTKLAEYAHAGLPILFSGGVPSYLVSYNASGDVYVNQTLHSLLSLSNVHVVPYDGLAASVAALGITPMTRVEASNVWYTYWRRDDAAEADYVFVYNDALGADFNAGRSQGTIEFASTGTPYLYSAWTGTQTAITNFTRTQDSTSFYLELAGNQSAIIAFHHKAPAGYAHGHSSDAQQQQISGNPMSLTNWTLIVEHWDPPTDLSNIDITAAKHNTTHHLPHLTPWLNITGLENVSGRGYYSTTFNYNTNTSTHHHPNSVVKPNIAELEGAIIDFGAIVHTLRVSINNHTLPPLDLTWAKADIIPYLIEGENVVEAVVSTPL